MSDNYYAIFDGDYMVHKFNCDSETDPVESFNDYFKDEPEDAENHELLSINVIKSRVQNN